MQDGVQRGGMQDDVQRGAASSHSAWRGERSS